MRYFPSGRRSLIACKWGKLLCCSWNGDFWVKEVRTSLALNIRLAAQPGLGRVCQLFEGTRLPIKFEGAHAMTSSNDVHYRQLYLIKKALTEVFRVVLKNGDVPNG
jgi:hypothetical protein